MGLGLFLAWAPTSGCRSASLPGNCGVVHAQATTQAEAILYPVDASAFPTISTFMDVFDPTGRFVSGLKPPQVTVIEDGKSLPVASLNEMVVPLQLAVVINSGPALGVRDKLGSQRFQGIEQALTTWEQALPPDAADDMSLVSLSGPLISHASAKDWLVSLQAFQQDFRATTPNLQSLQAALDTVAVQAPRVGMKRAVLFITPHMDDPNIETEVAALIQRAVQMKVHVFVWFTDTDLYTATESATAFNSLAIQTGGSYFAATGVQPYPDPESYFAPLRRVYALQYVSAVTAGGSHSLSVGVQGQAGAVQSADQSFSVDLQPPNPIFVSPPLEIVRHPPDDDPYNTRVLQPTVQPLSIIVEFPDGHKRSLVRTTLYVDGKIVAENKAEPFDAFVWDLSTYRTSGEHKIVVEAVDAFNLAKHSMEIPVTVTVVQAPRGLSAIFARYSKDITLGAVGLAGLVLLLILFMARFRTALAGLRVSRREQSDPVTQSIPAGAERRSAVKEKTVRRKRQAPTTAPEKTVPPAAVLRRLVADPLAAPGQTFKPAPGNPIPLVAPEITFGTDPVQSSYVLDDPSLAPRHARITRSDSGDFFLVDAGSVAGTWVNFEPVGQEANLLRHGDVIHLGQLAFRFELTNPPLSPEPRISKKNPG
jgi:hypothetical protein